MRPYWIIEHPSRGCFDRWDHDQASGKYRPFFHWSALRTDESIKRFYDKASAEKELKRISEVIRGCYLFEMSGYVGRAGSNS